MSILCCQVIEWGDELVTRQSLAACDQLHELVIEDLSMTHLLYFDQTLQACIHQSVSVLAGSMLTSIAGFSGALSRVLDRSLAFRAASGRSYGSGVLRGVGTGLLVPVSGALRCVSAGMSGLATAAGDILTCTFFR